MTMLEASIDPATEVTIPAEGRRRVPWSGGLPTERTAAVITLGALAVLVGLRGAFRGALGD